VRITAAAPSRSLSATRIWTTRRTNRPSSVGRPMCERTFRGMSLRRLAYRTRPVTCLGFLQWNGDLALGKVLATCPMVLLAFLRDVHRARLVRLAGFPLAKVPRRDRRRVCPQSLHPFLGGLLGFRQLFVLAVLDVVPREALFDKLLVDPPLPQV